jgi:electron transport complex protein RnfD
MSQTIRKSGPHIESRESVRRSMWEVTASLFPVVLAGSLFFGPYTLYLVFASAIFSALLERPFTPGGFSWESPLGDGSAFLAGVLFGLTLPPGTPWWMPLFGAIVIVFFAKQAFGGIGNNVFNPALAARAIILLAFPAMSTEWRVPLDYDVVTQATPLANGTPLLENLTQNLGQGASYIDLFLGRVAGSVGETSVLSLLLGSIFLFTRGYVGWRISVTYLGSAMVTALLLGLDPLYTILSGSIMFAALYMSTDMVTSPVARSARMVYGIGCGILTVLIREFTVYPEGVTFAVLLMNGLTPLIDVTFVDSFFGQVQRRKQRIALLVAISSFSVVALVLGFLGQSADYFTRGTFVDGQVRRDIQLFFAQADHPTARFAEPVYTHWEDLQVERVYTRENPVGYLVYASVSGYKSNIRVVIALDNHERIIGTRIVEHNESPTLGGLIRRPTFLGQFIGISSRFPDTPIDNLIPITGATISSRAVGRAISEALRFSEEPVQSSGGLGSLSDGDYQGRASGYQGAMVVQVQVQNNRITNIQVLEHRETSRLADPAFPLLTQRVIQTQSLDVEAVSGATGTSQGFLNALRNALD